MTVCLIVTLLYAFLRESISTLYALLKVFVAIIVSNIVSQSNDYKLSNCI